MMRTEAANAARHLLSFTMWHRVLSLALSLLLGLVVFLSNTPVQAVCPSSFPVTVPAGDTARLIEVIGCANATLSNDEINLAPASTYTLTSALPNIAASATAGTLTINGNGATITRSSAGGTPEFRIITVNTGAALTIERAILSNGNVAAGNGGGILNQGTLYLTDISVVGNTAATGGGIYSTDGTLRILRSTISGNTAVSGGGIANRSAMHLINSTVSGNTVTGAVGLAGGGGLSLYNVQVTQITNSTITNNTAAIANRSGVWLNQGALTIQNTIVANNNGTNNCLIDSGTSYTDGGNNLDNSDTCAFSGLVGQNADPKLDILAYNGGFAQTHALMFDSKAIDRGSNAKAVDHLGIALTTDERGATYPRVNGGTVDIGAYESVAYSLSMTVPASDAGGITLALRYARATTTNEVINLTNSTYTLNAPVTSFGMEADAGRLTINGNGATITRSTAIGTPQFRFFTIEGLGVLTLNQITLSNGAAGQGGAIYGYQATLTLTDVTLSGNQASIEGGGIYSEYGTTIIMNSTVSGNTAPIGGGYSIFSGDEWLINTTVSGNTASNVGGGLALGSASRPRIINSTITANVATNTAASGIWKEGGTLTIQNSIVANNSGVGNCAFGFGTYIDNGNNIDNGTSCQFSGAVGQNTNPLLGPLANNGGFTQTHALITGSPASNAGSNALTVDHNGTALSTDQRGAGFPRINNTTVDIGAYESITEALNVALTLQGRTQPAPHPSRVVTVHVRIMPSGGGSAIYTGDFVTSQAGAFTIPGLPYGTYLLSLKGTHTLARQATLTIVAGTNNYTTALLLEGDANDNNSITLPDFSILATAFGKVLGESGYDARADFNGDNVITISDFSLLASNFGLLGEGN